nr:ribonuclease H-like domain-containing protein [Tanacetum cinerariifolium]
MNKEMDALYRNETWEIFDFPKDRKSIELHETVYMDLPEGYYSPDNKRVYKLKKSLYGLKQTPRQWNAKLTQTLVECDFKQSKTDYSLFTKFEKGNFLALLIYVDDIIVTGNNRKYCLDLLSEYGLLDCKPSATPLEQNLAISNEPTEVDKSKKQHTLAKSSAEAEYKAMASVTSEIT